MHIPDGFISPKFYIPAFAAAAALWAVGARRARRTLDAETIPQLAVITALAFILMMIALPLPGGTSVHASGIALLAVVFGVWTAYLSVSLVLLLQALLFGMGGVTSLPVNALAMGMAGGLAAAAVFRALKPLHEKTALFAAGWISVVIPALMLAIALGVQPLIAHTADGTPLFFPFTLEVTLPAVLIPHALLGIGEGILTVMVYCFLNRLRTGMQA
jgi:cobalt/nickel transport system permease protein